ncbi:DAK2 domain-containing protein [Synergistales bacterium]|nr:DAK2 domain-containing protein [Synergistales bacterium]
MDIDLLTLRKWFSAISERIIQNCDNLIELDSVNGDGDLGISMSNGFRAVSAYLSGTDETDLGRLFMKCSKEFNESAPSSLGTIISIALMGMAKVLKGKEKTDIPGLAAAMENGLDAIMDKAKSKPGEKTILDSLTPAVKTLKDNGNDGFDVFKKAAVAAAEGSENTKNMLSVHGRAAYYGDKSLGVLDGGSVVGKLIFEAIADAIDNGREISG